ncbi:hypothetical protein [Phenylobacterium sp.]|jgi:hypothetical protein|uniref:hypothetical protein n=1 Tax=Phenylobacterium sp. TaxID=1871053 RepID=UPI002F944A1A
MAQLRFLKVQTPALRWRRGGRERRFGAHTFLAVTDGAGQVLRELHGIARGPGGTQLASLGGVVPFRREVLWGESWSGRSGFYDESFPQGVLWAGDEAEAAARLEAAEAVRAAVNARAVRYPWPAFAGANSNSYYATLLAGMGLDDVRLAGELWGPGLRRRLLPGAVLSEIASDLHRSLAGGE